MAKKSQPAVNGDDVIDFFALSMLNWHDTENCTPIEWLSDRCRYLESLVGPHLSKRATVYLIRFKGRKRYINLGSGNWKIRHAAKTLQYLYHTQAALKTGDVDLAIIKAMDLGAEYRDLCNCLVLNINWAEAICRALRNKRHAKQRGNNTAIFDTPEKDTKLELAFAQNHQYKDWLKRTVAELKTKHGFHKLSGKTARRRLEELGHLGKR